MLQRWQLTCHTWPQGMEVTDTSRNAQHTNLRTFWCSKNLRADKLLILLAENGKKVKFLATR